MSIWQRLFGKRDRVAAPLADYAHVWHKGRFAGFWFAPGITADRDLYLLTAFAMRAHMEGKVDDSVINAIERGDYRVVPNKYDDKGGCFVMFGSAPAPGEAGWSPR